MTFTVNWAENINNYIIMYASRQIFLIHNIYIIININQFSGKISSDQKQFELLLYQLANPNENLDLYTLSSFVLLKLMRNRSEMQNRLHTHTTQLNVILIFPHQLLS